MKTMSLKAILLDNDENFIKFLDPDLIRLDETREQYKLSSISLNYKIDDAEKAKELFKIGRKIWINGDVSLKDCLYVINESLKNDFFSENDVEFEAEEVLTELNYAPLFSHTSITSEKGFTIDNKGAVVVDRIALQNWFGNYFKIGVMQDCLNDYLKKISPVGTMTLMELLRYIEEETSNVFVTRYEKDKNSNVIHKYLDFLNPKSKKDSWNLSFEYHVPQEYDASDSSQIQSLHEDFDEPEQTLHNEALDEGDAVSFENDDLKLVDVTKFKLNIIEDGEILKSLSASEIGLYGRSDEYTFDLNYSEDENKNGTLKVHVIGYSYDENLASNPNATTHMSETDNKPSQEYSITLGHEVTIQLYNSVDNIIEHEQTINPILNKTVGDVLDLGFNVENVTFETDESDTFKAVAPILTLSDESGTNSLNKTDLTTIINRWLGLSVEKGQTVPMIVQRVSLTNSQKNALGTSNLENNYFVRPLRPNDSTDSEEPTFEYLRGTAYWKAPFAKLKDEIFVADDEDTGVEYDHINGRSDIEKDIMDISTPKLCTVETSDEDVYAIFNDVCMKLKDKRFPDLNIEVDVKNFNKNQNNSYNPFDKVYVKLPNCEELIIATVNKTIKNAYDIGENKVELSNYSNTIKAFPARTVIDGDNVTFTYPNKVSWGVQLINVESEAETSNKLITCTLLKIDENNNSSIITSYNLETDNDGKISFTLAYEPGTYQMQVNFGGDAELATASSTFDIHVDGTIIKTNNSSSSSASKKSKNKTKTKTSYYSKYGVSPDEKAILAIGKAYSKSEKKKYGTKHFWKVKFVRKCHCGSTKLFWGWNWGSKFRGKTESGSSTGRIICDKCGASYTIFGEGGKHDLTIIDNPVKSSKTEAKTLKKGKYLYDKWTVTVKPKKVSGNTGGTINRSNKPPSSQSGVVDNEVKKTAKKVVKNRTGVKAAKRIAKWIVENIKSESREGFYQSPATTLRRMKGNDCCKVDLLMHMLDAVGVMSEGIACYYVHVHKKTKKKGTLRHVFCKINGKWVDPMKEHPWGHYKTGYGAVEKAEIKRYPHLPFSRKYN